MADQESQTRPHFLAIYPAGTYVKILSRAGFSLYFARRLPYFHSVHSDFHGEGVVRSFRQNIFTRLSQFVGIYLHKCRVVYTPSNLHLSFMKDFSRTRYKKDTTGVVFSTTQAVTEHSLWRHPPVHLTPAAK